MRQAGEVLLRVLVVRQMESLRKVDTYIYY